MNIAVIVGAAAAIASTASFVPQAVKIVQTRDTQSISLAMYAITVAGFILWTSYGVLLGSWPLIASNGICLAFSAFILIMKMLPPRKKDAVARAVDPTVDKAAVDKTPRR